MGHSCPASGPFIAFPPLPSLPQSHHYDYAFWEASQMNHLHFSFEYIQWLSWNLNQDSSSFYWWTDSCQIELPSLEVNCNSHFLGGSLRSVSANIAV